MSSAHMKRMLKEAPRIVLLGVSVMFSAFSTHSDEIPAPMESAEKKDALRKPASVILSPEGPGARAIIPQDPRQGNTLDRSFTTDQAAGSYKDNAAGYQALPDKKQIEEKPAERLVEQTGNKTEGLTDSLKEEKEIVLPTHAEQLQPRQSVESE